MYWNCQSGRHYQIKKYPLTSLLSYPDIDCLFLPEIGLTYDSSGLILKWADVSRKRILIQSNIGLRPSLTTFWNRPAVNFAGGKWIRTQVGPLPQPYTLYVVAKFPIYGGTTSGILLDNGTASTNNALWYENYYKGGVELGGYDLPSYSLETNDVIIAIANSGASVISVNNVNPTKTGTTTAAGTGITLGARRSTDSSFFNGIVGPIVYFKSAHDLSIRKRIALLMSSYYSVPVLK